MEVQEDKKLGRMILVEQVLCYKLKAKDIGLTSIALGFLLAIIKNAEFLYYTLNE